MELCSIIGRPVVEAGGTRVGVVADLAVRLGDEHPAVAAVIVARRGRRWTVDWQDVDLDEEQLTLRATSGSARQPDDLLLLRRDVLDTQVFDAVGKRVARVADVRLARVGTAVHVVGVEVGAAATLRRLGLGRLARGRREDPIDWASVHLMSGRGHALQLASGPGVPRLGSTDLAELLARLPAERGAQLLERLPTPVAADALGHSRPRVGGRLVGAVAPAAAASIIAAMARDDAASALRHVRRADLDHLLGGLDAARAGELRRLLAHPPRSAGALMNPDVAIAHPGEDAATVRGRLAAHRPRLDAMLTVFVVDAGRLVGAISPGALIAGDATPRATPTVRPDAPVEEVVDLFALHDLLALPVVDAERQLLGAIAVDDILEELLVERLPGKRRFPWLHGRRR